MQDQITRHLTNDERNMAHVVFGESLEMGTIQLKTAWWVLKGYAVSPNGNIYFHPDDWVTDFSQETLNKQAWLIHELTHVWQIQQGIAVFRRALFDRRYDYLFEEGKSFFEYGVEQQARMVEDYYIALMQGRDCQAFKGCIPFLQASV